MNKPVLQHVSQHFVLDDVGPSGEVQSDNRPVFQLERHLHLWMTVGLERAADLPEHDLQLLVLRLLPVPVVLGDGVVHPLVHHLHVHQPHVGRLSMTHARLDYVQMQLAEERQTLRRGDPKLHVLHRERVVHGGDKPTSHATRCRTRKTSRSRSGTSPAPTRATSTSGCPWPPLCCRYAVRRDVRTHHLGRESSSMMRQTLHDVGTALRCLDMLKERGIRDVVHYGRVY